MGLVITTPPTLYCTIAEVRAFGAADSLTDQQITYAIQTATETIDGYTGTTFGQGATSDYTVNDVRNPIITLPTPFTNVTAVSTGGVTVPTTDYIVERWGVRLYSNQYFDADGFPRRYDWPYSSFPGMFSGGPWGISVTVTAIFGYTTVPNPVHQAAILLAGRFANMTESSLAPTAPVSEIATEGFMIRTDYEYADRVTTGDNQADNLLKPYRSMRSMIA